MCTMVCAVVRRGHDAFSRAVSIRIMYRLMGALLVVLIATCPSADSQTCEGGQMYEKYYKHNECTQNFMRPPHLAAPECNVLGLSRFGISALQELWYATGGHRWTNQRRWHDCVDGGITYCQWYGVTCRGSEVVSVSLPDNNLQGTIPRCVPVARPSSKSSS
jgi:hypothetical protein